MIECSNCNTKYERDPVDGRCELCRRKTVLAIFQKNKMKNEGVSMELEKQIGEAHKPTFEALQVTGKIYLKDVEYLLSELERKDKEHREDRIRETKRIISLEVENSKLQKEIETYYCNANQWNHEYSKERERADRLEKALKSAEEESEGLKETIKKLKSKLNKRENTKDDIEYVVNFYNRQLKRLDQLLEEILDVQDCSDTIRELIESYYEE